MPFVAKVLVNTSNCFLALVKLLFVIFVVLVQPLRLILIVMVFGFLFEFFIFRFLGEIIVVLFVPFVLYTWE